MALSKRSTASVDENALARQTQLSNYLYTARQVQVISFLQISVRFLFPSLFLVQSTLLEFLPSGGGGGA